MNVGVVCARCGGWFSGLCLGVCFVSRVLCLVCFPLSAAVPSPSGPWGGPWVPSPSAPPEVVWLVAGPRAVIPSGLEARVQRLWPSALVFVAPPEGAALAASLGGLVLPLRGGVGVWGGRSALPSAWS